MLVLDPLVHDVPRSVETPPSGVPGPGASRRRGLVDELLSALATVRAGRGD